MQHFARLHLNHVIVLSSRVKSLYLEPLKVFGNEESSIFHRLSTIDIFHWVGVNNLIFD